MQIVLERRENIEYSHFYTMIGKEGRKYKSKPKEANTGSMDLYRQWVWVWLSASVSHSGEPLCILASPKSNATITNSITIVLQVYL